MSINLPGNFTKTHQTILLTYLQSERRLAPDEWKLLYKAIDLLDRARASAIEGQRTFRQIYEQHIDLHLADLYIEQLLNLEDVVAGSPALTATFARQIKPILERAELVQRQVPESWLLLAYCVYWWQSFARGYTFEVEIIRDLQASRLEFRAHNIRHRAERFSPADLIALDLLGDIKTSIYFLQVAWKNLLSDFYITRLTEAGYSRTLVVFQKPLAWKKIDGDTVDGSLTRIMSLFPKPVNLRQGNQELIVVEYEVWKQKALRVQQGDQDD